MAKLSKDSVAVKLQAILRQLDSCSKKGYSTRRAVSNDFERIGDRVADLIDKIMGQRTPIY